MTDPGYPVYAIGTMLAGGVSHSLPLTAERGWVPDLDAVPADALANARLLWLCYPGNPTAAVAPFEFFRGGGRVRSREQSGAGAGRGLLGGCLRRLPLPQHPRDS